MVEAGRWHRPESFGRVDSVDPGAWVRRESGPDFDGVDPGHLENHENKWSECDKWSRNALDGKCGCVGLVWPKSEDVENAVVFSRLFRGE